MEREENMGKERMKRWREERKKARKRRKEEEKMLVKDGIL